MNYYNYLIFNINIISFKKKKNRTKNYECSIIFEVTKEISFVLYIFRDLEFLTLIKLQRNLLSFVKSQFKEVSMIN